MSEPGTFDRANAAQKLIRRLAASGPGSWVFARLMHHLDRPVHRLTRGRYTLSSLLSGLPVVMLTTVGAKSGHQRTVPLVGIPVPGGIAVVASNWGQYRHPAWYHNLRAHPDAQAVVEGALRPVRAVEADGERRASIWQQGLRVYPGFGQYERRASHRRIPIIVLEPR
jgi:deazaflavin-dependent oxidoreductase (nitroreductase family)